MKSGPIHDFILESEKNLAISAAVTEAWPEARDKLVTGFLDRLEKKILNKLSGWQAVRLKRFFIDDYPGFYFWKPEWSDQYSIALQCCNYGDKMKFGVCRTKTNKRLYCDDILDAVKTLHPSAKTAANWWEAIVTMRYPAPDWRKPEVLWRMHKDEQFLDDVAGLLLDVAKATESIIDRLVKKGK